MAPGDCVLPPFSSSWRCCGVFCFSHGPSLLQPRFLSPHGHSSNVSCVPAARWHCPQFRAFSEGGGRVPATPEPPEMSSSEWEASASETMAKVLLGVSLYPWSSRLECVPLSRPHILLFPGGPGKLTGYRGLTCTHSGSGASPTKAREPSEEPRDGRRGRNLPHKNGTKPQTKLRGK